MSVSGGTEDFLRTGEPEAPILLLRWKSMTDFIHPQDSMLVLQKLKLYTRGRKKRLIRPNLPSVYGRPSRKSKQADHFSMVGNQRSWSQLTLKTGIREETQPNESTTSLDILKI